MIYSLIKANKTSATGALSASIAHELNQPLGASNINIQFLKMKLKQGQLNSELGKEILDDLEGDNKRASSIVKSLRSIFTEDDKVSESVDVSELINNVLTIVEPELRSKNIKIELRVDQNLITKIRSTEIQQILLNLINNSIQAIVNIEEHVGCIEIGATQKDNQIFISISDNGNGVSEEQQSELFELLNTTKRAGMGLGLWLCKHIITRYGGSIHYEDVLEGGARFVIKLPQITWHQFTAISS